MTAPTSGATATSSLRQVDSSATDDLKKHGGEVRHLERGTSPVGRRARRLCLIAQRTEPPPLPLGNGLATMNEVDEEIARYTDENLVVEPEEERRIRRKIALHVYVARP
jgi:hypothetical protein